MKLFIIKIASIFLAFTVIFYTMSFSLNMHYCDNELIDTSIFNSAKTCGLMNQGKSPKECFVEDNEDCCRGFTFNKKGDNDLKRDSLKVYEEPFSVSYIHINLFKGLKENIVPYLHYNSPSILKELIVLYETFLI